MNDLRDLFQEVILDHYRKPRNFGELGGANRASHGRNPLCGDDVMVYVEMAGNTIQNIGFSGSGCAICTASASLMTEALKGKTIAAADELYAKFHDLTTGTTGANDTVGAREGQEGLGKLAVFAGVASYPVRVKCATLPWHTVQAALHGRDEPVSTEA